MGICRDAASCKEEIAAYISHPAGFPLLVGIDDAKIYANILGELSDDPGKKISRISDSCSNEFPPNPNLQIDRMRGMLRKEHIVWIGAAQSIMLIGQAATEDFLENLVGTSIRGHMIVLCPFCCSILTGIARKYPKSGRWIITVPGETRVLPSIRLYCKSSLCAEKNYAAGMKALLRELEDLKEVRTIPLVSACQSQMIASSMFPVSASAGPYQTLCKWDTNLATFTQETDGTEEQWMQLVSELSGKDSFSALCGERLGDIRQLPAVFPDFLDGGPEERFLCYLALKAFHSSGNGYLNACICLCSSPNEVLPRIYDTILTLKVDDPQFHRWMKERRRILQAFDENHALLRDYCERAAIHGKDILYYLGDGTEEERAALIHALCCYAYSNEELKTILPSVSPGLDAYLAPFVFDSFNTKVLECDEPIREFFTEYFQRYKMQKITNHKDADFIKIVEEEAVRRNFTKLPARSSIVKKMDKTGVQPYFFDALGIEFLSYIEAKCKDYDMDFACQIVHCNLPSITSKNKEFYDAFPPDAVLKEDGIDKLKHQGTKFDYRTTTEPLHIFDELRIIERNLKKISSHLATGKYQKAVIFSDHGASRLAVTYESENAMLELEEDGKHSGRCCPVDADPEIPFATYEDGFAVLANYERFKGSRKADVEAHGGASLEETIVPVVTLTAKPKKQQAVFVEDVVKCSPKDGAAIMLYASPAIAEPRLVVLGRSYIGDFEGDKRNIRFVMQDIRRKGRYEAEIYDGNKKVAVLPFETVRPTKTIDIF